ncbi:low-density lipoprotein receptor class a [Plakobranchus ocellatus]|uniref:Low-density lipoprotein receptor class a n=1 Tax=Plakobranchus ocellatus TaxID=259542 RepID=A0AAV4CDJ5_9GAST|nr:low-density lipoprotein receptor class a [Plakobranchus ocellatus]
MLTKVFIAAMLVATVAIKPKSLRASQKTPLLSLSEKSMAESEGTDIQVICSANTTQTPAILKWELSEDDKPNVKQKLLPNRSVALYISSLKRTNAGQYSCLLVMPDGVEEKEEFSLFVQQANAQVCSKYQFKCKETKTCLFIRYRCDNMDDCGDGSDEQCDVDPCLNKFRCNNSRCVEHKYVCDHIDHCGDRSDEHRSCTVRMRPTTTPSPDDDDGQYTWLQITVSTFIAATLGLVFLISFIVIMVFRVRVRKQREQRIARTLEHMYNEERRMNRLENSLGGPGEPPASSPGQSSDQQQFLLGPSQPHYGNIIVNVNNGVQYIPGYDYAAMMDVPPPYSEVGSGGGGEANLPPPPYSTLEHEIMNIRNHSDPHNYSQQQMGAEEGQGESPLRQHHQGQRCGTVPTRSSRSAEPVSRSNIGACQRNSPNVSEREPLTGTQTLPAGVSINSHFLQSLLGGPHLQPSCTGNCESGSSRSADNMTINHSYRDAAQDSLIDIVHHTGSPASRACQGTQSREAVIHTHTDRSTSHMHPGQSRVHENREDSQSNHNGSSSVPPSTSEFLATADQMDQHLSSNNCSPDHLSQELHSNEAFGGNSVASEDDEEDAAVAQNEEGTFLLRKPKHKARQKRPGDEAEILLPSSLQSRSLDGASNALLSEVSKRDDKLRPKPGHLSVQKGEILLHTSTGVLVDPPPAQISPFSRAPAPELVSYEAPELTIQNGALVFGSPKNVGPIEQGSLQGHQLDNFAGATNLECDSSTPHLPESSSLGQSTVSSSANEEDMQCRKQLQFKNGELVLELPKHTTSAQILSHLKGAYAEEDGMADAIEPVVNTKRVTANVVAKPQAPKLNSDVVLPAKKNPQ